MYIKELSIEARDVVNGGGTIRITSGALDRDHDIMNISGALTRNFLAAGGPVLWAHNREDPWAVIGKTVKVTQGQDYIDVDFVLRPSAGPEDPINIISLLWEGGWVNAASIGFRSSDYQENSFGGLTFDSWELVEWSLLPVGANQEALRKTSKGLTGPACLLDQKAALEVEEAKAEEAPASEELSTEAETEEVKPEEVEKATEDTSVVEPEDNSPETVEKAGRAISKSNQSRLEKAVALIQEVLDVVAEEGESELEDVTEKALETEPELSEKAGELDNTDPEPVVDEDKELSGDPEPDTDKEREILKRLDAFLDTLFSN